MNITLFSFLMSYWTMTIMIVVFFILRYFMKMRYRIGDLLFVLIVCLGRTFLPFEFPFTKEIPVTATYNSLIKMLDHKVVGVMSIGNILMLIWVLGTMVFLFVRVRSRYVLYKSVLNSATDITNVTYERFGYVFDKFGKRISVRIYEAQNVFIPYSFGFFKKGIVLPADTKDFDRQYYLMHEYGHHVHKDLLIMMIIDIWLSLFWWSPFSYLLRHKMEETLELNCDYLVTKSMSKEEKMNYLQSIVNVLKKSDVDKTPLKVSTMGLVRFNKNKFVIERFQNITKRKDKQKKALSIIFYLIIGIIVVSSYMVVFQSSFPLGEDEENGYVVDSIYYDEKQNEYMIRFENTERVLEEEEIEFLKNFGVVIE